MYIILIKNQQEMEKKCMSEGIKFDRLDFNTSLRILHEQLHTIDLYGYNK